MKEFTYTITDEQGIHARPAGLLVKEAAGFASAITIEKDGKKVDAKRILGVMGLGAKKGAEITLRAEGEDEGQRGHHHHHDELRGHLLLLLPGQRPLENLPAGRFRRHGRGGPGLYV